MKNNPFNNIQGYIDYANENNLVVYKNKIVDMSTVPLGRTYYKIDYNLKMETIEKLFDIYFLNLIGAKCK